MAKVMMGLPGRIHARESAPFHVQIELEKEPAGLPVSDEIEIRGRVARVFRGDGRVSLGDRVTFVLWVCRRGDEPTGPAYMYDDDFGRATHMEVYLFGNPPQCQLAAHEFKTLSTPTDEPTMTVQELRIAQDLTGSLEKPKQRRESDKKWWQFWKTQETKPSDWITKYNEPCFRTRREVEEYVASFVRQSRRAGALLSRPDRPLAGLLRRRKWSLAKRIQWIIACWYRAVWT